MGRKGDRNVKRERFVRRASPHIAGKPSGYTKASGPAFEDQRKRNRGAAGQRRRFVAAKALREARRRDLRRFRKHPRKVLATLRRHNRFPWIVEGFEQATAAQQREFLREAYEKALEAV